MPADQTLLFEPSASSGLYAQVLFRRRVEQAFTYAVPIPLLESVAVGKRVVAPFGKGNALLAGFVVELHRRKPDRAVKSIHSVIDDDALLTPPLLDLIRWLAGYYLCGFGRALDAVVPAGAKSKAGTRLQRFLEAVPVEQLPLPPPRLTAKQAKAIEVLRAESRTLTPDELAKRAKVGSGVVQTLVEKGYAMLVMQRVEQMQPLVDVETAGTALALNADQARALAAVERAIAAGGFHPFLLHGVTGSGKTEIYLRAIEQTVRLGRQAIVLVPEISLTPQTIAHFRGRFPRVAVLHSHLSDPERGGHWRRIAAGEIQVVVGARSAVFAPTPRLGLIVVDEEHETTFKQESPAPRYHARDVAVMRAHLEKAPIVLGSATPSLESWNNVQRGKYTLLSLPKRVLELPLPKVALIDMRHEPIGRGRLRAISPSLERKMREALDKGGQVILLLNRRGFDTQILCPSCGQVVKCKFCDVALTHHRQRDAALCHYCGFEQEPPARCPACGLSQIRYFGLGTEKLEAEIAQKFPNIEARRMDSDAMKKHGSHAKVLDAFRRGDIRILFGTQMIAKGLDFPNVTLVGVVSADTALYLPDFRSAERTFQLLAQVAGRTGRGAAGGSVIVQSFNPEHPCIALAAQHDYLKFAEVELAQRKEHGYPPFARMARLVIRAKRQDAAADYAEVLAAAFRKGLSVQAEQSGRREPVRVLGPAEAPVTRLKNYYRYHFQLQSPDADVLHDLLCRVLAGRTTPDGVHLAVDIDPFNML